jgi:diguanylate cyclase (GGDEF)-like protein
VAQVRHALAFVLAALLLVAGLAMVLAAERPAYTVALPVLAVVVVLVPVYVAGHHFTLDYELRNEAQTVSLVQLPLALGVQLVAPVVHLAARVVAALTYAAWTRQGPLKALFNVGTAVFELGAAALALTLVHSGTGPLSWLALYAALLLSDVVTATVLALIWRLLGMPVSLRQNLGAVLAVAPITAVFAAAAVVALAALRGEPLSALVMLGLVSGLALAYRAHRRTVAQQQATEALYEFVKDLGPLHLEAPEMPATLERVRLLLHAQQLDLAVREDDRWCHLLVVEGQPLRRTTADVHTVSRQAAATGTASLRRAGNDGGGSMATPLLGAAGLTGVLTAVERMGAARGFDMKDLRLLETVGSEVSAALERGRLLQDLERAATTDTLTGLPNLAETTRLLGLLLEEQPGGVVLAAVAVDSFREVNDTLGHEVGDELLLEVTRRLRLAAPHATLGRIGGGRFALALPSTDAEPEMFGLHLRTQVEGSAQIGPVGTHVRLSVGVVHAPEHGREAATLLRRAETAMYSARHAHGGPLLWEPVYEVQGQRRLAVVTALREALVSGAIGVAYQPKVDTVTGQVSGVEALARWTHPALGAIGPDEFIPLAEASGLMGPLTRTVLQQSATVCQGWQRRAPGVGIAVNVSADTVLDPAFVTEVSSLLAGASLDPTLLTLELTEGVVVSDPDLAATRMTELRGLGVRLSVDDFGTGYSSLTYLKGLPVDEVKIDKGFVRGLSSEPADRAVVRAVVDIAHTLGLKVVAEGVEQEDQQGILRALGVDEVQGYLHARPMPALDVAGWLRERERERHRVF